MNTNGSAALPQTRIRRTVIFIFGEREKETGYRRTTGIHLQRPSMELLSGTRRVGDASVLLKTDGF